jgi:hypothetical protein
MNRPSAFAIAAAYIAVAISGTLAAAPPLSTASTPVPQQNPVVVQLVQPQASPEQLAQAREERADNHRLVNFNGDLARYTWVLAVVAILELIVLAVQTIFLRLSFREARRTADIARDAMVAGERAFVFAMNVRAYYEHDPDPASTHWVWRLRPVWKNSGDTPTRRMRMHSA